MLFRLMHAQIEAASGNRAKALSIYQELFKANRTSLSAATYSADELKKLKKYAEARKVLRKAVRTFPRNVSLYRKLALVESETGSQAESHRATAEAYALLGNYKSAIQQLNIARSHAGKDDFYVQASITARIKEFQTLDALENQKK